ncbi:cytochrome C assembly family protein [Ostreibacterium oceani]|uniref:Cytochrome c assembly protein domain-containing protein n=1 Tax=Ostreibacterium oceani TaxID=2654998 RepID=A0A6N7EWE0_9GAMM|nr:cytochrome c biogenesis protein CcsA [Ostreibacterium oceani]MPV85739.1 hypothetical protein [Ostreibacterium oceani]
MLVALFAFVGYMASVFCLTQSSYSRAVIYTAMAVALGFHALQVASLVGGIFYDTAVMGMLSLLTFSMVAIGAVLYIVRHDSVTYCVLALIAAICVWLPVWIHSESVIVTSGKLRIHVVLSMAAYIALGYAALYASFWLFKNRSVRQIKSVSVLRLPLAYIERAMVLSATVGALMLTLSLATGVLFIRDIWGQHLAHKLFFGLLAWLIIVGFLFLHYYRGFRGKKGAFMLLSGFVFLVLAYFGSAFVLQILLDKQVNLIDS